RVRRHPRRSPAAAGAGACCSPGSSVAIASAILGGMRADVVVVGAGLAGLVATSELLAAGRRVVLVDQESAEHLGGQAHWSFGGLFLVDSPEQRRMGVHDSVDLAWQDWTGSAGFDRVEDEDSQAVRWARA